MIQKLRISNFALIQDLELDLNNGFTVLTGETGSGKSILLNAFSLLLGERAHSSLVGVYGKKAIVEAIIESKPNDQLFFETHNLDFDKTVLVRREIVRDGKSRAFINDSPVSLSTLKAFSSQKLMVHSQYNTFELKSKTTQLELYDLLSGNEQLAVDFANHFEAYQSHQELLNNLKLKLEKANKDRDYHQFLQEELSELKLKEINYKELEGELFKLENADEIRAVLNQTTQFTEENGIYSQVRQHIFKLEKLASKDKALTEILERLHNLENDLNHISSESSYYIDSMDDDPERKTIVLQLWDDYNRLLIKHKLSDQSELIELQSTLSKKQENLEELNYSIVKSEKDFLHLKDQLYKRAEELHSNRLIAKSSITTKLKLELEKLKLPETKLDFEISRSDLKRTGITNLSMIFSANKGYEMIEIENAASGGELSRLMLALLKQISEERNMPTILFDEIDSGVSGDVADKIGVLLKSMGQKSQLIVISHLPQVASKAESHIVVEKKQGEEHTQTYVRDLNQEERVYEVARLMSGEVVSKAALATAKSLMN
ncbi:MAG: AAA family ATPase [Crocinitomicaceae bacterium]|nr:AAA family ATPase [Crocinitomicaceae bacterium]